MSFRAMLNSAVVAAIVGALTGAIASGIVAKIVAEDTTLKLKEKEKKEREERLLSDTYKALLFGREIVFWIAEKQKGDELAFERRVQSIHEYLTYFKITNVELPPDPVADNGKPATDFVNSVTGRFQISNHRAAAALLLAWNGMLAHLGIDNSSIDDSWIDDYADRAGLPQREGGELNIDYLQRLMNQGEQKLSG